MRPNLTGLVNLSSLLIMTRQTFDIANLYLRTTFQSRGDMVFALVLPLIFTLVLGQAMGSFAPSDAVSSWTIHLVNADGAALSTVLTDRLEADDLLNVQAGTQAEGLAALAADETVAVVTIPTDFSAALLAGETMEVDFHVNGTADEVQIVETAVNAALTELEGSVAAANTAVLAADQLGRFDNDEAAGESAREAYFNTALREAQAKWQPVPPVAVAVEKVSRLEDNSDNIAIGTAQSAPGMMIMFSMFFMLGGAASLVEERGQGTLRRLLVMPIRKAAVLLGKFEGIYFSGLIQIGIIIIVSGLLMGVGWGQAPFALLLVVLGYAFSIAGLGIMMAALARTQDQVNSITTVLVLVMAPLGGAWWPLEIVPEWMQTVGHLFPTAWAMDGFSDIVTRGLGVGDVLLETAVLFGFGVLFLAVGVWRFRYE